jgi:hypothetical protein
LEIAQYGTSTRLANHPRRTTGPDELVRTSQCRTPTPEPEPRIRRSTAMPAFDQTCLFTM